MPDHWGYVAAAYAITAAMFIWYWRQLVRRPASIAVLRPDARKACRVLLGPVPESEEYEHYWNVLQKRQPPAEHQPPQDKPPAQEETPARAEAPGKRKRKKADS